MDEEVRAREVNLPEAATGAVPVLHPGRKAGEESLFPPWRGSDGGLEALTPLRLHSNWRQASLAPGAALPPIHRSGAWILDGQFPRFLPEE